MSSPAIKISGLSKSYRIVSPQERHRTFRENVVSLLTRPFGSRTAAQGEGHPGSTLFWALDDVSLDLQHGEVAAVIGRNGAGKSTLLKILSRITEPSKGRVEVYGRLASLLEVGTGFHPELTGRENIFLNGAILGMRRREIQRKLDEIIAFAEVPKFIDTQVKYYSSGMYTRLAFAVAAHLDPDILVIDEVLAVGDAAFQKKCLGKMGDVARSGRTVIFVSHNMAAVSSLCTRAFLLEAGHKTGEGSVPEVIDQYNKSILSISAVPLKSRQDRRGDKTLRICGLSWETSGGEPVTSLRTGGDFRLILDYECPDGVDKKNVRVCWGFKESFGGFALLFDTSFTSEDYSKIPPRGKVVCEISKLPLTAGQYSINVFVGNNFAAADAVEDASTVDVESGDFFGTGHGGHPAYCKVLMPCRWELRG